MNYIKELSCKIFGHKPINIYQNEKYQICSICGIVQFGKQKNKFMKIKYTKEQSYFIEQYGTQLEINQEKWYYSPFFYRKISECVYETYLLDQLPITIKKILSNNNKTLVSDFKVNWATQISARLNKCLTKYFKDAYIEDITWEEFNKYLGCGKASWDEFEYQRQTYLSIKDN